MSQRMNSANYQQFAIMKQRIGGKPSSLHTAVLRRDGKTVTKMLNRKDVLGAIDEKDGGRTALFRAVLDRQLDTTQILLEHGASPDILCQIENNQGDRFDWTALHEAARSGDVQMLSLLLHHGSNVNIKAHKCMSALHVAAWHGHMEVVKVLIDRGCNLNQLDEYQESAMVVPICNGHTGIVRLLLQAGCKLNSRSWANTRKLRGKNEADFQKHLYGRHGPYTLLLLAVKYSWLHLAVVLLQHGFNPKYQIHDLMRSIKCNIGVLNKDGETLVRCFLDAGYHFRGNDERMLNDLLMLESQTGLQTYNKDFICWLLAQCSQPLSLTQLCKVSIRSHLRVTLQHQSIMAAIQTLPLPPPLIQDLSLAQYDGFVNRHGGDSCIGNGSTCVPGQLNAEQGSYHYYNRHRRYGQKTKGSHNQSSGLRSHSSRAMSNLRKLVCFDCICWCAGGYDESAEEWVTSSSGDTHSNPSTTHNSPTSIEPQYFAVPCQHHHTSPTPATTLTSSIPATHTIEPLYFAMPRKQHRTALKKHQAYLQFWKTSCCCR